MKRKHQLIAATAFVALFNGATQAAAFCSAPGPHPDGLSVSDMTFEGANAHDCYGVVMGNDQGMTDSKDSNVWGTETDWVLLAKDDGPTSSTVLGVTFTLATDPTGTGKQGTWELSWTQTGEPGYDLTMDIVGVLKASDRFASYQFKALEFTANDSGSGTWKIAYENNGGNIPNISHLSLYYKDASSTDRPPGGPGVPTPVPLALIGLGLVSMSWLKRKSDVVA